MIFEKISGFQVQVDELDDEDYAQLHKARELIVLIKSHAGLWMLLVGMISVLFFSFIFVLLGHHDATLSDDQNWSMTLLCSVPMGVWGLLCILVYKVRVRLARRFILDAVAQLKELRDESLCCDDFIELYIRKYPRFQFLFQDEPDLKRFIV